MQIQEDGLSDVYKTTKEVKKKKTAWRWWAKALGEKASKCDKESDKVAIIRTIIFVTYLITNCFIVAGVVKHWNDETQILIQIEGENFGSKIIR
jgi:hypothetical protein